jgi:hypothetical protein
VNVAFPVGDIDQPGVGQSLGQIGAVLEAGQLLHAFLGLDRLVPPVFPEGLPVARPQPGVPRFARFSLTYFILSH